MKKEKKDLIESPPIEKLNIDTKEKAEATTAIDENLQSPDLQTKTNSLLSKCLNTHSLLLSISNSFIKFFIPLIILSNSTYINTVAYLLVNMLSIAMMNLILYKLIKNHPIVCIALYFVCILSSYLTLSLAPLHLWIILIIAFLNGTSNALYSAPIQNIITNNKKTSNFAFFNIFKTIGVIIMLLINGYILNMKESFSVWLTSLISGIFFILSYIPFILIRNKLQVQKNNGETLKDAFIKLKKYHTFNSLFGIQDFIVALIIPIFLMVSHNMSMSTLVYITVIINIVRILIQLLANYMYQHNKSIYAIGIGCLLFGISCLIESIVSNHIVLYVFAVIPSITFPLFFLTTFKEYSVVSENYSCEASVLREFFVHIFRVILIIPMFFIDNLRFILYIGIVVAILMFVFAFPFFNKKLFRRKV